MSDTLRRKRNMHRNVVRVIKMLNRMMRKDVFGERFTVRLAAFGMRPYSDHSGWESWWLVEFYDAACPERNFRYLYDYHNVIYSGLFAGGHHVDSDLNEFIVNSDFWKTYNQKN